MSVTYGFYNSIKGDRKYNALEMSSIFDGIIVDGVYMSIGDALNVKSSGGMGITVGIGRAWFNHTWTLNDSLLPLTLANSDVLLNRIDAIVLEVNNNTEVRKNTIKILKGTPSSKPVKPTMTEGELLNQHPLAYISIPAGATSISQSNIENAVGTSACPYVTGVLKGMDIDKLVAQWGAQWAEWLSSNTDAWKAFMSDNTNEWKSFMAKNKNEWSALINGNTSEFETWFEHMKDQLSEDAAGNLQLQVDNLNNAALGGDFVLKGSPVSVEYMGANRIAAITAYGENAQGGTTEAPVALTGVDSVHVCGRNLLPLPYSQVSETKNGLNIAVNADGTITVSGTATAETYLNLKPIPASLYRLMGVTEITPAYDYPVTKNGFTFFDLTIQPHVEFALVYIVITKGSVVNRTYRPYIIKSAEPPPYETYQGSVTPLPIPRALHEVGDVRDVCRTRVKSVWDKSVQVDITQLKKNSASPYQYYINVESNSVNIAVKPAASTLSYNLTTGIQPFKSGINFWMNGLLEVDDLEHAKAWFTEHPTKVFYQSTAYNGTNGLDVCLTEYQTGFVELDGTEGIEYQSAYNRFAYTLPSTAVNDSGFCSHYKKLMTSAPGEDKYIVIRPEAVYFYDSQYTNADAFNAYLAAQKAAGTPVQIVYQLATPETYATDPVDFDNTAGPLTVLTGGAVEVRMTELIGSRTYDADGDGVVDKAAAVPWDGVTGKPGAFTPSAHTHDDRYYTETEMNTKLNGKANSSHTHTKDQVGLSKVNNNSISMGLSGTDLWVYYS